MEALPLGERIRAARLERKMTQDELAKDTFSKSYVSAVELGKIHPSIKALRILARRLQLPASHFLETLEPDVETQLAELNLDRAQLLVTLGSRDSEALEILNNLDRERLNEQQSAEAVFMEGRLLSSLDNPTEALLKLEQAMAEFEELEQPTWVERVRNLMGEIYFHQHKYVMAQEAHKTGLKAIKAGLVREPNLKLAIYANLARVLTALDMHDAARALFKEARQIANGAETPEVLVDTLWKIAKIYEEDGNLLEARQFIEQGRSALETADTSRLVTHLHLVFGGVYLAGHNWPEAENCFQSALDSASPRLPGAARVAAYNSLANLYQRQNRLDEALDASQKAHRILLEEGDNITLNTSFSTDGTYSNVELASGEVLLTLARIHEKLGNLKEADEFFEKGLEHFKKGGRTELLSAAFFSYGEVLLERGDSARGANYLKIAYEEKSKMV